jgi:hypothetical protein
MFLDPDPGRPKCSHKKGKKKEISCFEEIFGWLSIRLSKTSVGSWIRDPRSKFFFQDPGSGKTYPGS